MARHTPGPWCLKLTERNDSANGAAIWGGVGSGMFVVVKMPRSADRPYSQKVADLHLIAAAPELLAQLEWAESVLKCFIEGSAQLESLRATIAKAKGNP